jgi:hypothetical protein
MGSYEYKVIPAPARGRRGRGISGAEGRFAHSLEIVMNEMAAEGWEYQRAETLPSEERAGLTAAQTVFRYVLVFRRKRSADLSAYDPRVIGEERKAPLLLPPVDNGVEPGEAHPGDGGLKGLLRRRAATVQSEAETDIGPGPEAEAVDPLDDLAARFAEDEGEPAGDEVTRSRQRPAAE